MLNVSILKYSRVWLSFSALLVGLSLASIAVFGLNLGIDFTGGSLMELKTETEISVGDMRAFFAEQGVDAVVQSGESGVVLVRTRQLTEEEKDALLTTLGERVGVVDELRFDSIGPVIGRELRVKSTTAVILLSILVVLYVAYAFRKVAEPVASWKYGLLTIIAALHDVIVPIGVFAVLGAIAGFTIDSTVIAALLTILGYSINDTIVIFDRTRENLQDEDHPEEHFTEVVDHSLSQSVARSINTSLTTLLVLFAIYFLGGETTRTFVLTLIIGVTAGTYSSIFLASPLLVKWQSRAED